MTTRNKYSNQCSATANSNCASNSSSSINVSLYLLSRNSNKSSHALYSNYSPQSRYLSPQSGAQSATSIRKANELPWVSSLQSSNRYRSNLSTFTTNNNAEINTSRNKINNNNNSDINNTSTSIAHSNSSFRCNNANITKSRTSGNLRACDYSPSSVQHTSPSTSSSSYSYYKTSYKSKPIDSDYSSNNTRSIYDSDYLARRAPISVSSTSSRPLVQPQTRTPVHVNYYDGQIKRSVTSRYLRPIANADRTQYAGDTHLLPQSAYLSNIKHSADIDTPTVNTKVDYTKPFESATGNSNSYLGSTSKPTRSISLKSKVSYASILDQLAATTLAKLKLGSTFRRSSSASSSASVSRSDSANKLLNSGDPTKKVKQQLTVVANLPEEKILDQLEKNPKFLAATKIRQQLIATSPNASIASSSSSSGAQVGLSPTSGSSVSDNQVKLNEKFHLANTSYASKISADDGRGTSGESDISGDDHSSDSIESEEEDAENEQSDNEEGDSQEDQPPTVISATRNSSGVQSSSFSATCNMAPKASIDEGDDSSEEESSVDESESASSDSDEESESTSMSMSANCSNLSVFASTDKRAIANRVSGSASQMSSQINESQLILPQNHSSGSSKRQALIHSKTLGDHLALLNIHKRGKYCGSSSNAQDPRYKLTSAKSDVGINVSMNNTLCPINISIDVGFTGCLDSWWLLSLLLFLDVKHLV